VGREERRRVDNKGVKDDDLMESREGIPTGLQEAKHATRDVRKLFLRKGKKERESRRGRLTGFHLQQSRQDKKETFRVRVRQVSLGGRGKGLQKKTEGEVKK